MKSAVTALILIATLVLAGALGQSAPQPAGDSVPRVETASLDPGLKDLLRLRKKKAKPGEKPADASVADGTTPVPDAKAAALADQPSTDQPSTDKTAPAAVDPQAPATETPAGSAQAQLKQQRGILKRLGHFPSLPIHLRKGTGTAAPDEAPEENSIENERLAYAALARVSAVIAEEIGCKKGQKSTGQTVTLYEKSQPEELLTVRSFSDQLDRLQSRMARIATLPKPVLAPASGTTPTTVHVSPAARTSAAAADADADAAGRQAAMAAAEPDGRDGATRVYSASAAVGPLLQPVMDLVSILRTGNGPPVESTVAEGGVIASVAHAAIANGCTVYWPEQYVANPLTATPLMNKLRDIADIHDNSDAPNKPAGLQQRSAELALELKRAQTTVADMQRLTEDEKQEVADITSRINSQRDRMDWISKHSASDRDPATQQLLNESFVRSWKDLEARVTQLLARRAAGTMEDEESLMAFLKNLDLVRARTDTLSTYVRDVKDTQLRDEMKTELALVWKELDAAETRLVACLRTLSNRNAAFRQSRVRWDR
jgi:hypothetical protein